MSAASHKKGLIRWSQLQAADMHAAAEYLTSIGKKAVGLMGHSKAGSGVLLYAANYGHIPRIANVSGRFDHKKGKPSLVLGTSWHLLPVSSLQAEALMAGTRTASKIGLHNNNGLHSNNDKWHCKVENLEFWYITLC